MKNLSSLKPIACAMMVLVASICISSCQKMPVADKNNAYRDDVPNRPDTEGLPIIGSVSPLTGIQNTVVTLAGINIDPVAANSTITVAGFSATINSVSVTAFPGAIAKVTIVFTLPPNAISGKIVLKTKGKEITWPVDFKVLEGTMSTYANLGSNYIEHLAIDNDGIAYGESATNVYRILQSGQVSQYLDATRPSPFQFIWGIGADQFGDLYVPDAVDHRIYRITTGGVARAQFGDGGDGIIDGLPKESRFGTPRGIAVDKSGNLYVTDVHRVRKIASNGVVSTIAGSAIEGSVDGRGAQAQFGSLDGIAVDTAGNIYVSDRRYLNIRKIRPDGTVTTLAGSGQAGFTDGAGTTATFSDPRGLVADLHGNVYVADQNIATGTHAIRVINKLGNVSSLIKSTSNVGVINGPTSTASVSSANGLAFGPDENLYIVNTGANIISKVTFK